MAQCDSLDSIPGAHGTEGANGLLKAVLWLLHVWRGMCVSLSITIA